MRKGRGSREGRRAKALAGWFIRRDGVKPRRESVSGKPPDDVELFSRSLMAVAFGAIALVLVYSGLTFVGAFGGATRAVLAFAAAIVAFLLGLYRDGWT